MKIIWILILIHGNVSFILYWLFLYLLLHEGIIRINERFKRGKLSGFLFYFHYTQYAQLWIFLKHICWSCFHHLLSFFKYLNRKYLFMPRWEEPFYQFFSLVHVFISTLGYVPWQCNEIIMSVYLLGKLKKLLDVTLNNWQYNFILSFKCPISAIFNKVAEENEFLWKIKIKT